MRSLRSDDFIPPCFTMDDNFSQTRRRGHLGARIGVRGALPVVRDGEPTGAQPLSKNGLGSADGRAPSVLSSELRRFFWDVPTCPRTIFAERFGTIATPRARRTDRLDGLAHCLAIALGKRPAARLARRLAVEISNDTLLRVVRRRGGEPAPAPSVIGIDHWAWRRNHRYGTLICDLERRGPIALLPDREPATAEAWLAQQPQIAVVARDRGGSYAIAARRALPHALQVADRWHLMENASQAFLGAVRKSMRQIRTAVGAATIDPALLTCAEKLQYEGYLRREDTNDVVIDLSKQGISIKDIVRRTGHSRGLVRRILRGQRSDVFRTRQSSLGQRHHERSRRRRGGDHLTMVERPDRGADLQAQARQTPNVWPQKNRSPSGSRHRTYRHMIIESASEPSLCRGCWELPTARPNR